MSYPEAFALIASHWRGALGMMLLFFGGALLAIPVYNARVKILLWLPRRFARMLLRILKAQPGPLRLGAFIFLFNVNAIFLYMLTGVVPFAPVVVCLWAGLNVSLASGMAQRFLPRPDPETQDLPWTARLGALLTFLLELPCLWFALAIGQTIAGDFGEDRKSTRLNSSHYS